ncbi:hypothetical protein [Psychrobacillus sp. NPDC096623]|uniref:hypothetical protein n=1 Tax=Psychrobacillus sp. NPDC096623 TaxID=3364492 RepID=UPI0037F58801
MTLALLIHLFFGMSFAFVYGIIFESSDFFSNFNNYWVGEGELNFIAGIMTSFFFWTVDEVMRRIRPKEKFFLIELTGARVLYFKKG